MHLINRLTILKENKMKKALGFVVIILTFFFSCSENDELLNNESIIYQEGNVQITLIDIEDGRCPINDDCVWQGNAEVRMRITNESETKDFILNTAGSINESLDFPTSTSIFGINVELLDLQPYPEDGMEYTLEDYTLSISVN